MAEKNSCIFETHFGIQLKELGHSTGFGSTFWLFKSTLFLSQGFYPMLLQFYPETSKLLFKRILFITYHFSILTPFSPNLVLLSIFPQRLE